MHALSTFTPSGRFRWSDDFEFLAVALCEDIPEDGDTPEARELRRLWRSYLTTDASPVERAALLRSVDTEGRIAAQMLGALPGEVF